MIFLFDNRLELFYILFSHMYEFSHKHLRVHIIIAFATAIRGNNRRY